MVDKVVIILAIVERVEGQSVKVNHFKKPIHLISKYTNISSKIKAPANRFFICDNCMNQVPVYFVYKQSLQCYHIINTVGSIVNKVHYDWHSLENSLVLANHIRFGVR